MAVVPLLDFDWNVSVQSLEILEFLEVFFVFVFFKKPFETFLNERQMSR